MSRRARIATVVRIRDLQERVAEAEAAVKRREADRRSAEVESAIDAVDQAAGDQTALSFLAFARRQTGIEGALFEVERRTQMAVAADRDADDAAAHWHAAHQRHEAVDRLLDRAITDHEDAMARRSQGDVDEIVTIAHGRRRTMKADER